MSKLFDFQQLLIVVSWLILPAGAKRLLILGLLLCLSGCSSTTFLYNRLDTLIGWYVRDYVPLSRDQRNDFNRRVEALLDWHRADELPEYVAWLTEFEESLDDGVSEGELNQLIDQLEAAASRLQIKVLDLLIDFGATLSYEQRIEFVLTLQQDQADLEKKYRDRTELAYYQNIQKQFQKNLSRFLGALNDAQKQTIEEGSAEYQRLDFLWLEDRGRWVTKLEQVLRMNDPDWPNQTRKIYIERRDNRTSEYEQAFARNTGISRQIILSVLNQRTSKQDRRLRREIERYRTDFEALIESGQPINREVLGL
ncbi:MAG: DUF6279 family lipoprotein [Halieaceae bacterium]